jgi:hypothetical protein
LVHLVNDVVLDAREYLDLEFTLAGPQAAAGKGPTVDVQVVEINGQGDQLDISLTEVPKDGGSNARDKRVQSSRYHDGWEDGVAYEALLANDLHENTRYRVRLANKGSSARARASMKLVVTERFESTGGRSDTTIVPKSFSEVMRVKPKVPGLKESSFISGSKAVMAAFKVASLQPFLPKS